jgi:hypothetical protein
MTTEKRLLTSGETDDTQKKLIQRHERPTIQHDILKKGTYTKLRVPKEKDSVRLFLS